MRKTELLIPAGSLDVLKTAVIYGADAVYIYMISVRRTDGLPQTSFRFYLTADTLVLLAMCFPLTGALRTFTFKINARAGRTDTPTRVLANGRGFLRHGRTPQRAITSPLHPVTSLPLSRLFCGYLF